MISAAVSTATVAGAPIAAGIAVASLVAFAAFAVTTVNAFTDAINQTATRAAELDRRLNNDGAFDGSGAWPRSTTEITGDGSITDGDGTDWPHHSPMTPPHPPPATAPRRDRSADSGTSPPTGTGPDDRCS